MSLAQPWNPRQILDVYPDTIDFHCVGLTLKGVRCDIAKFFSRSLLCEARDILDTLPPPEDFLLGPDLSAQYLLPKLKRLAFCTLCPRWHQRGARGQVESVATRWLWTLSNVAAQRMEQQRWHARARKQYQRFPVAVVTVASVPKRIQAAAYYPSPPSSRASTPKSSGSSDGDDSSRGRRASSGRSASAASASTSRSSRGSADLVAPSQTLSPPPSPWTLRSVATSTASDGTARSRPGATSKSPSTLRSRTLSNEQPQQSTSATNRSNDTTNQDNPTTATNTTSRHPRPMRQSTNVSTSSISSPTTPITPSRTTPINTMSRHGRPTRQSTNISTSSTSTATTPVTPSRTTSISSHTQNDVFVVPRSEFMAILSRLAALETQLAEPSSRASSRQSVLTHSPSTMSESSSPSPRIAI